MRPLIAMCLLIFNASLAIAHPKTDVVMLYNGDRITGEIKGLNSGILRLNTEYADTINIEWRNVAQVTSDYSFELLLASSERLFGSIGETDTNGAMTFKSIDKLDTIELMAVTQIRPIEETFSDRLSYSINANFQLEPELRSNRIQVDIAYEDKASKTSASAWVLESVTRQLDDTGDTENSESTSSAKVALEHQRWTDRGELYRTFTATYDMNEALQNDGRISVGAGLGRYFIDQPGMRLSGAAGLQGTLEQASLQDPDNPPDGSPFGVQPEDGTDKALEAFIQTNWLVYEFGNQDLDVTLGGNVYPSLSSWGRIRANANVQLSWEVMSDFYWNLTATAEYDSDSDSALGDDLGIPKDTNVTHFDYSLTMGLKWAP